MTGNERGNSITIGSSHVQGVLLGRIGAWLVDVMILFFIAAVLMLIVAVLGVLSMGFGFVLMPATGLAAALGYAAITIGGPKQATLGMRMAGIKVVRDDGSRPDGLIAAVHALMFWVAAGTVLLLIADIVFALIRSDRRMGHDVLTGLAVVRA